MLIQILPTTLLQIFCEVILNRKVIVKSITVPDDNFWFFWLILQGVLVGFKGDMIHTFNKNECSIHKSDYFQKLEKRENLILLGDSTGDLRMAEGAKHCKNILKIGFLNDKVGRTRAR